MRFKYSFWESKIPRWTGLSSECLSHVSRNHRGPEECTRGGFKANKVIMLTGCLFRNTTSNIFWQKNDLKKEKKISPKLHVQQFLKCLSLKWSTSSDLCLFHQTLSVKEDWGDFLQQMWCAFINQKSKSIKKKVAVLSWCDWCLAQFPFSSPDQTNRRTPGVSIATCDEVEKTFVFLDVDVD